MLASNIEEIKSTSDLLSIIGRDTSLRRAATTRGGEYAGTCPFCGGKDRFRVQPERHLWWCRQCSPTEHWQDVIAYVQKRDGVEFADAIKRLKHGTLSTSFMPIRAKDKPAPVQAHDWHSAAQVIVNECKSALWSGTAAARGALDWLHKRGLNDETLKDWHVGFNPQSRRIGSLWVESGITIPYFAGKRLHAINVRRSNRFLQSQANNARKPDKYRMVTGSQRVLFGASHLTNRSDVIIVEGEFDAMLVWQEACQQVDVLTMGAAKSTPQGTWLCYLLARQRFYIVTDNDQAGNEAAARWLELVGKHGTRHLLPNSKDVSEFWQNGGNVRQWIAELVNTKGQIAERGMRLLGDVQDKLLSQEITMRSPSLAIASPSADFSLTIDQIVDGELEVQGWRIVGGDPDLYGSPWRPKLYVQWAGSSH